MKTYPQFDWVFIALTAYQNLCTVMDVSLKHDHPLKHFQFCGLPLYIPAPILWYISQVCIVLCVPIVVGAITSEKKW